MEPLDDIQVLWEEYLRELSRLEFDQALDTLVDKIFVNMSMFLRRMLEEIEELEKEALKQPVAGYLLKDMKRKNEMGKREKNFCNS